jgi:hypothetical protein
MVELAHYEWVEMALQQSEAEPLACGDTEGLLDRPLQVSPLALLLAYAWPVQLVGPQFQPDAPLDQPTLLLVRRDPDFSVKFSELSPLAFRLLQRIEELPGQTGRVHLQGLAAEAGMTDSVAFMDSAMGLLRQMQGEGVVA